MTGTGSIQRIRIVGGVVTPDCTGTAEGAVSSSKDEPDAREKLTAKTLPILRMWQHLQQTTLHGFVRGLEQKRRR